jgi:hypothetical protein
LLELHNNDIYYSIEGKRKTLVDILEWVSGFSPDCVASQLRQLEKIYYTDQIQAFKKELKELENEPSK